MNQVILMGRLAKDPEMRTTQNGTVVTTFSIAVNRQDKEKTADFINCVAWRKTAEFVNKYFSKGRMIALVGRLQSRTYTDKEGNNRSVLEVVAESVEFTGEPRKQAFEELDDAEELPF